MEGNELYAAYFKTEKEYYLGKLNKYQNGQKFSFNGYAFLFGIFWFMYRKMYVEAFIILFALFAESFFEVVIADTIGPELDGKMNIFITILFATITGMLANTLYIKKAGRIINKAKEKISNQETLHDEISRKGGTSYLSLFIILGLIGLIVYYYYQLNN